MEVATGSSIRLSDDSDISHAVWIGDGANTIVYLKQRAAHNTKLMILDADHLFHDYTLVAYIHGHVEEIKLAPLEDR